jgi:hypothetical protein
MVALITLGPLAALPAPVVQVVVEVCTKPLAPLALLVRVMPVETRIQIDTSHPVVVVVLVALVATPAQQPVVTVALAWLQASQAPQ